jgi:hypothetical protein
MSYGKKLMLDEAERIPAEVPVRFYILKVGTERQV